METGLKSSDTAAPEGALAGAPTAPAANLPPATVPRPSLIRRRDAIFRRSLALADLLATSAALVLAVVVVGEGRILAGAVAVPLLFVVVAKAVGLYDRDEHLLHRSTLDEVPGLFAIATLAALLLSFGFELVADGTLGRVELLSFWGSLFLLLVALRALARHVALRLAPSERCLLIGDAATAEFLRAKLAVSPAVRAELVAVVEPGDGGAVGLPLGVGRLLESRAIDRVILAANGSGRDQLLYSIRELKEHGVKVSVLPEASRVAGSSVELDHLHGVTLLGMRRFDFTRSSRAIKRAFDLVGASVALVATMPLLALAWVAIRLDSGGPSLFRQRRVGRHGQEFEMLKLRTMVNDAEQLKDGLEHLNEGAEGLFKIRDDPRVTRVGRWLRPWQIDELPQLWNVIRGEMSLVGPRPLIPEEDRKVEGWYRRRLDVPPGITGHWQILGSSRDVGLAEMVKLDYLYVANWSLWGDVRLLLRTLPFIVRRRGL